MHVPVEVPPQRRQLLEVQILVQVVLSVERVNPVWQAEHVDKVAHVAQ